MASNLLRGVTSDAVSLTTVRWQLEPPLVARHAAVAGSVSERAAAPDRITHLWGDE